MQNYNVSYHLFSATLFGKGVYLAMKTEYPAGRGYAGADSNGHKRIYNSLVFTEHFAQGVGNMAVPPPNPSNPGLTFGSTVDNMSNHVVFVVLLEYLITFT